MSEIAEIWTFRKKLAEKKRILNDKIRHQGKLIDIAKEALAEE